MILLHFPIPIEIQQWFGLKHTFLLLFYRIMRLMGLFFSLFLFLEKSIIYFMWCQCKQCIPEQSKEHNSLTLIPVLHLVYLKSLAILKPLRINYLGFNASLLWLLPAVASHRKEDLDINKWCCIAFTTLKTSFFLSFIAFQVELPIEMWLLVLNQVAGLHEASVLCGDSAEEIRCFKELNKLEGRERFL